MKAKSFSSEYGNGSPESFRPQLTSLIDVMTILLVFLIQNFSVEGNLITPSKDLTLPASSIKTQPAMMTTVQISGDQIMIDGKAIVSVAEVVASTDFLIPQLYDLLKGVNERIRSDQIMLEADRELPFNVIKRVAYTCGQAGFTNFSVLVYQEEN